MKYIVNSEQMKNAEKNAVSGGLTYLKLMENAGTQCYKKIVEVVDGVMGKTFVILCGRGNNGGDGIVIAQRIMENGGEVLCIFVSDLPASECARECYSKYSDRIHSSLYTHREETVKKALSSCDIIVDCVFGTGFTGELEPKIIDLFDFIHKSCNALKFSVDIPSGINADTGEISDGAFQPDVTFMLGAAKAGLFSERAFELSGSLVLLDIGIPLICYSKYTATIAEDDILHYLPKRKKTSHKGTYGKLLNIAGSERFCGSALLSTKAALKCGVGLCTLASPKAVCRAIACAIPESTFLPLYADELGFAEDSAEIIEPELGQYQAVALGCGMGSTKEMRNLTKFVITRASCPIILDADGINSLEGSINSLRETDEQIILTPHPKEFSRLTGLSIMEIQNNRLRVATAFAREWGVILVLKGANTVIAAPDGRLSINATGNAGLAKGGSGDVLTGIIASFIAQGVRAYEACVLGCYLHGLCADRLSESVALAGIMPSDVADYLPFVMKR